MTKQDYMAKLQEKLERFSQELQEERTDAVDVRLRSQTQRAGGLWGARPWLRGVGGLSWVLCPHPERAGGLSWVLCPHPERAGGLSRVFCPYPQGTGALSEEPCPQPEKAGALAEGLSSWSRRAIPLAADLGSCIVLHGKERLPFRDGRTSPVGQEPAGRAHVDQGGQAAALGQGAVDEDIGILEVQMDISGAVDLLDSEEDLFGHPEGLEEGDPFGAGKIGAQGLPFVCQGVHHGHGILDGHKGLPLIEGETDLGGTVDDRGQP